MILKKPYTTEAYAELALFCNQNNAHITDKGDYLESEENPAPAALTYRQKRAAAFPSIAEQLDMIYWDKVNGTNLWQQLVAGIKAQFPKE